MIQSYQNLFGLEPAANRTVSLLDNISLRTDADNPFNSLMTSPLEVSNSFASYLQTLQTKYREETNTQTATTHTGTEQSTAKSANESQAEANVTSTKERNQVNQGTDKQAGEPPANMQEKPERKALNTGKNTLQTEGKLKNQTENKTVSTGMEKIFLADGEPLANKVKTQGALLQEESKSTQAVKAGKTVAANLLSGANRETGKTDMPGNNSVRFGENLSSAAKTTPEKKPVAENLQTELEKAKQSLQQANEAKKGQATGQKEESSVKHAHKVVVIDLRTPEQVRLQENQQVRTPKHLQKVNDKKDATHTIDSAQGQIALHKQDNEVAARETTLSAKESTNQGQSDEGNRYTLYRPADALNNVKEQPVNFTTGAAPNSAFAQRLNEALQSEVLKNTSFIVKNDGNGEIRLVLKPESLGQIRIKISINNNHLDGRIIVENDTIREIVEANLKNLDQAFKEAGFATTSLGVSVGQEQNGQGREASSMPEFRPTSDRVVQQFENNLGRMEAIQLESLINMMA